MVLVRKTNFFLGKTKKTIILDFGRIVSRKWFLFVFPRKKLVFLSKTIFSQEIVGFPLENQFFVENLVFHSKTKFFVAKSVYVICCLCALRSSVANKVLQCHSLLRFNPA